MCENFKELNDDELERISGGLTHTTFGTNGHKLTLGDGESPMGVKNNICTLFGIPSMFAGLLDNTLKDWTSSGKKTVSFKLDGIQITDVKFE